MSDENQLPVVDEDRIKYIFGELEGMEVELDPDPLEYGPKRLNRKVALARGMLTRCERIFLQVSHDLQLYKRTHRAEQLEFDLKMQDLYANEPEVRAGRNVKDREALATMRLRGQRESLMSMEVTIGDLEMVMTVVKAKRADLRDVQGRIRDQIKLCQEEIGLGASWRSKLPPGVQAPDLDAAPKTDPAALAAIQELAEGDDGEVHLAEGDTSWMEGETSDVDELLDELEAQAEEVDGDSDDESDEDSDDDDDDGSTSVEDAWEGKNFDDFPQLGYCSVCGEPSHDTPSGSLCKNDHGGADWTDEPPEAEPEPEPEPDKVVGTSPSHLGTDEAVHFEETPDPEPEPEPDPEPEPKDEGLDVDDLFGDETAGDTDTPKIPEVKSDDEVDDFFDQIDATPAKTKKAKDEPAADVADDDLDDLIGMFADPE